jgi:hypothetical protein
MQNDIQTQISDALRATVESLNLAGRSALLVGRGGINYLIAVMGADESLTDEQREWLSEWSGQVTVCDTIDEALQAVGAIDDPMPIALRNFWATLEPTAARGVCPKCQACGLETRSAEYKRRKYFYVHHCSRISEIAQR